MRKLAVMVLALGLAGCVGLGQGLGGDRMKVITEFDNVGVGEPDAEGNPTEGESIRYKQTVIGQPGDVIATVAKMEIRVQNSEHEYWTILLAQDADMDSTAQAAMLQELGLAEYQFAAQVSSDVVEAAINAVLPGYLGKLDAGIAEKQIGADTLRLIAAEVVTLIESGVSTPPPE